MHTWTGHTGNFVQLFEQLYVGSCRLNDRHGLSHASISANGV